VTISCRILLRMRNFLGEICKENLNPPFVLNNFFLFPKSVPFMRYKSMVQSDRPRMTI